jgi:hypothetical protein
MKLDGTSTDVAGAAVHFLPFVSFMPFAVQNTAHGLRLAARPSLLSA